MPRLDSLQRPADAPWHACHAVSPGPVACLPPHFETVPPPPIQAGASCWPGLRICWEHVSILDWSSEAPAMSTPAIADRNLVFGLLALQMEFVSRDQLIE